MPDFKFPGDATSLPEFRLFEHAYLNGPRAEDRRTHPLFIFTVLKLVLSYQAGTTERLGFLSDQALRLLEMELGDAGVAQDLAMQALEGTVLEKVEGGWMDAHFARLNAELSPKHRRHVDVGAAHSVIKRNRKNIEAAAAQQQMLLPPESFRDSTGEQLSANAAGRVLLLIITLDHCLLKKSRAAREMTSGLVADGADADAAIVDWTEEQRFRFFYWIADMKEDPRMYNTTELILSHFAHVLEMYKAAMKG